MPAWPGNLPAKPLAGTLTVKRRSNTVEFETEVGPPIRRRRATAAQVDLSGEYLLTDAQRQTLDTFFAESCKDGSLSFDMNDPVTGEGRSYFWTEPPSYSHVPGSVTRWRTSIALSREP